VLVLAAAFGVFALFLTFAVPLAITQASHLANDIPGNCAASRTTIRGWGS
jgi:predicted PurR-regulated permease PerM